MAAKIGFPLASCLGLVVYWASFASDIQDQTLIQTTRNNGLAMMILVPLFNFALLTVFALSVEKHLEFYKDMTSTKDFWKSIEK